MTVRDRLALGRAHILDIAARAEMSACPAQDDGAIARLFGIRQSGDQLIHHLQRHGVAHLGPVQRHMQNPGAAFDQ